MSSEVTAIRRGRASISGTMYSLISIVTGSKLAILFVADSANQIDALGVDREPVGIRLRRRNARQFHVARFRMDSCPPWRRTSR